MATIDELGRSEGRAVVEAVEGWVDVDSALRSLADDDVPMNRFAGARSRRRPLLLVAAAIAAVAVGTIVVVTRDEAERVSTAPPTSAGTADPELSTIPPVPSSESTAVATEPTTAPTPVPSDPASAPTTNQTAPLTTVPLTTMPLTTVPATTVPALAVSDVTVRAFGSQDAPPSFRVYESDEVFETVDLGAVSAGALVLAYTLRVGISADADAGTLSLDPATDDGQLTVTVRCAIEPCSMIRPRDQAGDPLLIEVRTTDVSLTEGLHVVRGRITFSDGATTDVKLRVLVNPVPSEAIAQFVSAWTGEPKVVQRVVGVGGFAYNLTSAFGSIWVVGNVSDDVTRIDATTGEILAVIRTGNRPSRVTATGDAVYVGGEHVTRIDPANNTATAIETPGRAAGIIGNGQTVWATGTDWVQRIDGVDATTVAAPPGHWFEAALSNGLLWLLEEPRFARLLAVDAVTGEVRHELSLENETGFPEFGVRLVADEDSVVVGIDTSGGGGRTGELVIVDPATATIIDRVVLGSRPEGIVLTDDRIWTSGAVVDRNTLGVRSYGFGFGIAVGPDGSVWGTTGRSGGTEGVATRHAPGNLAVGPFQSSERPPLAGRWFVANTISGYPWSGDPVGVQFTTHGHVRLSGCNEHDGEIRWAGSHMAFAGIETTKAACAPHMEELDNWLRELLLSRPEVSVEGTALTITATVQGVPAVITFDELALPEVTTTGPAIGLPVRVTEGTEVVVELHAVAVGGVPEPLGSRFRLTIERREGAPFLVIDSAEAVVPDGVEFWVDKIDGRTRLVTTARQGSTRGSRLTDAQATNGIDVVIEAVDVVGNPVAASAPVS